MSPYDAYLQDHQRKRQQGTEPDTEKRRRSVRLPSKTTLAYSFSTLRRSQPCSERKLKIEFLLSTWLSSGPTPELSPQLPCLFSALVTPPPPPVPHSNPATLLHDSLTLSLFLIYFSLPRSLFRFLPSKSASKQASVAWGLGSSGNFSERQRRLLLSPSSAYLSLTIVSSKSSGTFRPYLLPPPVPFSLIALL